jgi:hypothetical protein
MIIPFEIFLLILGFYPLQKEMKELNKTHKNVLEMTQPGKSKNQPTYVLNK